MAVRESGIDHHDAYAPAADALGVDLVRAQQAQAHRS
jgi:hypothetical protein